MENHSFLLVVFVPRYLVLIGELFFFGDDRQRGDVGLRERRLLYIVTVERGVVGNEAHFGFLDYEG